MPESRLRRLAPPALVAAVPALIFLDVLLGWGCFYIRDIAFYHFPSKSILREIVRSGELPFWNAFISAGQPLAANPAHEVFYPLTWLILLPDYIYGFQLLALVHVPIAALATYAFLRSLSVSRTASTAGGLSFGLGGFILSGLHIFPFLFSAAWMPLTLMYGRKAILRRTGLDAVAASFFLALQCLVGEPVTLLQTGLMLGIFAIAQGVKERRVHVAVRHVVLVGLIGAGALLIAAVQMIPAMDHAADSVRSEGFTFEVVSDWSTPPARLLELFFPAIFGSRGVDTDEPWWGDNLYGKRDVPFFFSIYSGLLIALLAVAGVLARARGRGIYLAVAGTSLLLALGSYTPLLWLLFEAGITRSIRYPEKFLIMGIFATVVFASIVLDRLLAGDPAIRRLMIALSLTTLAAAVLGWASTLLPGAEELFVMIWSQKPGPATERMVEFSRSGWGAAILRSVMLLALVMLVTRIRRPFAVALVLAFVVADLASQVTEVAPRIEREFFTELPPTAAALPLDRSDYRIFLFSDWAPSSRNSGPYAARRKHHLRLQRNALNGLAPASYGIRSAMQVDFDLTMLSATHEFQMAMWELSEKSPDWLNYAASMSNIWFIGRHREFKEALAEAGNDARRVQPIRWVAGRAWPRYYFATEVVEIRDRDDFIAKLSSGVHDRTAAFVTGAGFRPAPARVVNWQESPNGATILIESSGVSFLVMSVSAHKYWNVRVDGIEVTPVVTNLGYQGIAVPAGRHTVEMRYHNPMIAAGAGVSAATILALGIFVLRRTRISTMPPL